MRTLLVLLGLGLIATAITPSAAAVGACTPRLDAPVGGACAGADRCHTLRTEGICFGGFAAGVGGARGTCQHADMQAGFCSVGGGAAGHGGSAGVGCQRVHGAGCHAGVGADGHGLAGAGVHASRAGACAGAGSPAAGQGARQCVAVPH